MMIAHLYQGKPAKRSLLRTNDLAAGPHEFLTDCLCACNGRLKQSEGLPELLAS